MTFALLLLVTNLITVTASPITESELVTADGAEIAEVSSGQIARLGAQDLTTALRQIPGVTVSRYAPIGNFGGAQGGSIYIRGMGTARPGGELCTYVDGAPHESGVWGHPLLDSLPLYGIARVTVHKNPEPGRFGGTFAAIDLETKRRRAAGYEGELDLAYGRFGTLVSSASAGLKEDAVDAYAGASFQYSDGARHHSAARLWNSFAHLGVDLSDYEYLAFNFQKTASWVNDPGDNRTCIKNPIDRFNLDTELYNVRFETNRERFRGYSLLFFDHGDINWEKAESEKTQYLNFGTRSRYEGNIWADLWLVGGLDVISDGGHSGRVSGRTVETAPYLGARYDWSLAEHWTLTPSVGTRYSFHTAYKGEWQPEGTLTLAYDAKWSTAITASRSVHYPGLYVEALALNDIHAENMVYYGWNNTFTLDTVEMLFTLYRQEISDRLERTAQGYVNTGEARSTGLEASVRYHCTEDLTLFAGGAFAQPDAALVSRLPRWTFSAGSTWRLLPWLEWSLDGQYIGAMYAYSPRGTVVSPERLGDGFLFNTRLAVPLDWGWTRPEFYVAIENFTNQKFEYYPGYPMPGVMYYLGAKFKF